MLLLLLLLLLFQQQLLLNQSVITVFVSMVMTNWFWAQQQNRAYHMISLCGVTRLFFLSAAVAAAVAAVAAGVAIVAVFG